MNAEKILELYEGAMQKKYGYLFPITAPIKEVKQHVNLIEKVEKIRGEEYWKHDLHLQKQET